MKKMGRPLKFETALSHDIKVRVDDELFSALCSYCKQTGQEKAAVMRICLRNYLNNMNSSNSTCSSKK